jgi:sporadic carbohydrate cluster protein (TIGR04323 family)
MNGNMTGNVAANRQGYRGYVTSRGFGEYRIPVPLQSLALRDYCARNGMRFVLPVNENSFPHSYLVLEGMVEDLTDYDGIVMCSHHMLPQRPERRRRIYQLVLEQGCSLHMVIEGLVVASPADVERVEELLLLDRLAPRLQHHEPMG